MSARASSELTFGRIHVKPTQRQLFIAGEPVKLGARAFDLLMALIERRDRVVDKDELLKLVWPSLVVEENNLQVHVSVLRKLLGPDAIATIPGRGYQFIDGVPLEQPLHPRPPHDHNLPQQLTSFIGRKFEIAAIQALLADARLLTLTGSGGCGKTRISVRVGEDLAGQFPDGVWFVEFAPLADPGLVPKTMATVLNVVEEQGKTILQSLAEQLQHKHLLLIFDNCEHVISACAQLADTLMRSCPDIKILASSRELLGVAGEQTYRVPSLSLPDLQKTQTPETVTESEAATLFIQRAILQRPDFQITRRNANALASLCCQLDGIPLAIELAAARVRSLSVEEIDGRLDQRFQLLTGGSRTALHRQQTLRAMIDWSYELLAEPEKLLLQRLSVFVGGWTLASAEFVCAGEAVADFEVLDLLASLSGKSLAVVDERDGCSRYRLLETVRHYAIEKLRQTGHEDAIRQRHLDHFVTLVEKAEPNLTGREDAKWLLQLDADNENLRAALAWSCEHDASQKDLRLCAALSWYWSKRGQFNEGREWCTRVLGKRANAKRTLQRVGALSTAGTMQFYLGDFSASWATLEECLGISREIGNERFAAMALNTLGNVLREKGQFSSAKGLHEEALGIRRSLGDRRAIAVSLSNFAGIALDQGDYTAVRALLAESLVNSRAVGDRWNIASIFNRLALVAFFEGDHAESRTLLERSLEIRREAGDRTGIGRALGALGTLAYEEGDLAQSLALHRESLIVRRALGDMSGMAFSLEGLAEVAAASGQALRAVRLWGAVERLRFDAELPLPPVWRPRFDRIVEATRVVMSDADAFRLTWTEGRGLTLDQALDVALEVPGE